MKGISAPARQQQAQLPSALYSQQKKPWLIFFPQSATCHGGLHCSTERHQPALAMGTRGSVTVEEAPRLSACGAHSLHFTLTFLHLFSVPESHPCWNGNFWSKVKRVLKGCSQMRAKKRTAKSCVCWRWQMHWWQQRQNMDKSDSLENCDIYTWRMHKESACDVPPCP